MEVKMNSKHQILILQFVKTLIRLQLKSLSESFGTSHKASVTSINTGANVHSADWLMSIFVNELAPPHVHSQQGK